MESVEAIGSGRVVRGGQFRMARPKRRVVILGAGRQAVELGQALVTRSSGSYEVVGFLDRDASRIGERVVNPSIIGTYDQLFEIVEHHGVSTIAVCLDDRRSGLPVHTLLDCKSAGIDVVDGNQLYEAETGRLSIDVLKPSSLIFSSGFRRRKVTMWLKRGLDILLSSAGLILLSPLFGIVALLIKLDSSGPVFYRQVRTGQYSTPYKIWKFRSMRSDAEEAGAQWAVEGDPRVTKVGRWLRFWRIDELPQLINVLCGDMSLVGPRPERPVFVQDLRENIPYYDLRHTVRPGITGWAQIRFRYGASAEDMHMKLQYDLYYVKNLSLLLDMRILAATIRVVLQGEGAR